MSSIIFLKRKVSVSAAITHSCTFNGTDEYLSRTPSAGNRDEFILSFWYKTSAGGNKIVFYTDNGGTTTTEFGVRLGGDGKWKVDIADVPEFASTATSGFNDGTWQHMLISADAAQGTNSNRIRVWFDGVEDSGTKGTFPDDFGWNQAAQHEIGRGNLSGTTYRWNGSMAQVLHLEGVSIQNGDHSISDFYSSGPVNVNGLTRGTNGFLLPFDNSSAMGEDQGAGSNDWTLNGIDSSNQSTDTP